MGLWFAGRRSFADGVCPIDSPVMSAALTRRALVACARLVLACAAGCSSPPSVAVDTPWGVARADDEVGARALAEMLSSYGPRVRALLPDARSIDPEVWLDDFSDPGLVDRPDVVGLASPIDGRIRIRADRLGLDADFVLVHELVHALLGDSWAPLPALVKEGLCDALASRLALGSAASVRALRLLDAAAADDGMALELSWFESSGGLRERQRIPLAESERADRWEALSRPGDGVLLHHEREGDPQLYGCGWLVAERAVARVGVDGLHALCLRATREGRGVVPLEWLLEAGGLKRDSASWHAAVLEQVGETELRAQCQALAPQLATWIATSLRSRFPTDSAAVFLDRALPTVGWEGGRRRVSLATVPDLARELVARWDGARPVALRPGDGWWMRDPSGVHLTTLMPPSPEEPGYTIARLALLGDQPVLSGGTRVALLPQGDAVRLELLVTLRADGDGLLVRSRSETGFQSFSVQVDGVERAAWPGDRAVTERSERDGATVLELRLPGAHRLEGIVLFHATPNVLVTQRLAGVGAAAITLPLWVPPEA